MRAGTAASGPRGRRETARSPCDMHDAVARPWAVVLSSDVVGLGAVRSLHAGGVPTLVVMLDPLQPARASRYRQRIFVPTSRAVDCAPLNGLPSVHAAPPDVIIPTSGTPAHSVTTHGSRREAHDL